MPDETINVRYQVTTEGDKEAIERAKELRKAVDEVKKSLVTVAQASGTRYKESAQALIEVKRTTEMAKVPMIGQGEFAKKDEVALAQAEKNISEYVKLMAQAQTEVTAETNSAIQARGVLNANEYKQEIALAKQKAAAVAQTGKEQLAVRKQNILMEIELIKQAEAAGAQTGKEQLAIRKQNVALELELLKQDEAAAIAVEKEKVAAAKQASQEQLAVKKQNVAIGMELAKQDEAATKAAEKAKTDAAKATVQNKLANTKQQAMLIQQMAAEDAKAAKQQEANQKKLQASAKTTGSVFQSLGNIIKNAFSFFLGGTIFAAIYRLINGFQELVKTGEDYAQTIYRLGVSINQLQRRGLDITIQSEIALIKELQAQYTTFSKKGVIEATTSVQMLTRNFGFNQEQIKKTIQLSMDLALVQGKDVGETAKQLALFYSSGYGEGLQHAGLAVNRMTVMQEAHRMGLKKSYMQLTELERATAAYNLVTRQSADLHADAARIQDSLIGKIKEQRSAIENVTNEIALKALPVELAWLKLKKASIEAITDWLEQDRLYKEALAEEGKPFVAFFRDKEAWAKAKEELKKQHEEWEKILSEGLDVKTGVNLDLTGGDQEAADARAKLGNQIRKWMDDIEQADIDHAAKEQELAKENADALVEITKEAGEERIQAWDDYAKSIEDIERDLAQEIADAQLDAARKQEDLDREYALSVQDANRKYHENELKAERDYQERMRRLREEFLFDLEDALRARDALQVLRLIRRYNLDKEQEKRNYEEQRSEAAKEHQNELQDLARQHAEEERQNQESLQRQIEDARAAAAQKLEDAKAAWIEESNAIDAKEAERLEAEKSAYIVRQLELDKDLQTTKDKINKSFGEWLATEGYSLDQMHQILTLYMGEDGKLPAIFDGYLAVVDASAVQFSNDMLSMQAALDAYVADAVQQAAVLGGLNLSPGNLSPGGQINAPPTAPTTSAAPKGQLPSASGGFDFWAWLEQFKKTYGYAKGGSIIANKPTTAIFGEAGPELATFTPLNQLKTNITNPSASLGGINGAGGIAKIELWLSPDLEARVVDNTLGEVATILKGTR